VDRVLKPKRRRRLTPEQIDERSDRLRIHRFRPASDRSSDAPDAIPQPLGTRKPPHNGKRFRAFARN
jgi:hypothetical protein